jgi:tetratricopeptide (TPR) repeat protein
MLAAFAAPVLAQSKECNDENKAAWYDTFLKNYKGEPPAQKIAYDAAKLYLSSCPEDPADQIASFMKNKFVVPYEKMMAGTSLKKDFEDSVKQKKYADQIKLGKQIVATEPDNSNVYIIMGVAGLGDETQLAESAQFAKKAIEMIESGKPPAPLASKDEALAYLNYTIAKSLLKSNPTEAITYYVKAAKFNSDLKKNPQLYTELAGAYGEGPIAKLSEEYKAKYTVESPESKLAAANINQVIDRQIDALARAAALTTDAANKKAIMDVLTGLYKDRNKSEAGLNELIASVLSKPIPELPVPLTSLPTPAPSSTPGTSGTSTNGAAATGTTGAAKTGTTTGQKTTGSVTASGTGTAKPAASPTPSTKKPRSNHRRG